MRHEIFATNARTQGRFRASRAQYLNEPGTVVDEEAGCIGARDAVLYYTAIVYLFRLL